MSAIEKELHHRRRALAHLKVRARLFLRTNIRHNDLGLTAVAMATEFMQLHKDLMPGWEGTCELRMFASP